MIQTKIQLIEKIEGEAKLHFHFENKKITHTEIEFLATRNIEKILEGKMPLMLLLSILVFVGFVVMLI